MLKFKNFLDLNGRLTFWIVRATAAFALNAPQFLCFTCAATATKDSLTYFPMCSIPIGS